jgi:hypothetical protein
LSALANERALGDDQFGVSDVVDQLRRLRAAAPRIAAQAHGGSR